MALHQLNGENKLLYEVSVGNQIAFAELFNGYYDQISQFVNTLTNSDELTEEILLDVFTKIWVNRESLIKVGKFNSYLFILVRNHTLNCIRKENAERKNQEDYLKTMNLYWEPLFTENHDERDYQGLIDRAVNLLPSQQHKVFSLRQKGLKNPEIAQIMDLSPDSVKKYQQLAMKFVSEFVKNHAMVVVIFSSASHFTK